MDTYLLLLLFGGLGLAAMGMMGLGSHGHDSGGGHAGHGGHGGHGDGLGHAGGHGHVVGHGHGHGVDAGHGHAAAPHHGVHDSSPLWQLMSPRIILAVAFGMGATGLVLRPLFGGVVLLGIAAVGGLAVERLVVRPLWNLFMRFGSNPALTLESAVMSEALVTSSFDAAGHGMVSIEVDGQVVQLLASLRATEIGAGARVRVGDRVRIEDIDAARNRCTVTRL